MENFSDNEKIKLFDEIAKQYYNRNFGTMMKADIDVMIFSAYMNHKIANKLPYDDYTLSKELGLTESKVRSLKERKHLKYPDEDYNWKKDFVALIPTAKYNKNKELVQMCIEDVNLMKEVRHYFIEKHYFDEHQLNSKLLQCNIDFFVDICTKLDSEEVTLSEANKKHLKELSRQENKDTIDKIISGDIKGGIVDLLKSAPGFLLGEILKSIPFGNLAKDAITSLIEIVTKST